MKMRLINFTALASAGVLLLSLPAVADVRLPNILSDNMVLQRDKPVALWGWAEPGEKVTVKLAKTVKSAVADNTGRWSVTLAPHQAGGPYTITVAGKNTLKLSNVMFGEVWVCSGQSNMATNISRAANGAKEVEGANFPKIRLFSAAMNSLQRKATDCTGRWYECSPETVKNFSAVGYLYGRRLHQDLNVPIGLIQSAMGGTNASSWTPLEAMENDPQHKSAAERARTEMAEYPAVPVDQGGWEAANFDDSTWKQMDLPQPWEKSGMGMDKLDGVVWFRKVIEIPADWAGRALDLHLGPIDDGDTTYFDGKKIGAMDTDTPDVYKIPRNYPVPSTCVKGGKAVLAIRMTDRLGDGGLVGTPEQSYLCVAGDESKRVALAGAWKFQIADRWPPVGTLAGLYNGMIAPLTPMGVKGVIWYQGESNASAAGNYKNLLSDLISGWRSAWADHGLSFVIIQLPNYMDPKPEPGDSTWATVREAQQLVAANMKDVSLVVTIDLGDAKNIHPTNKQDVATRAALAAEANIYGKKDVIGNAPSYAKMTVEGDKVRVSLANTGGSVEVRDGAAKGFALAGKDGKFYWAEATIDGQDLIVHSADVPTPTAVRYGWADNPGCNVYGKSGLPLTPFRSDIPTPR